MKLNDSKIKSLVEPGKYADGDGLYLEVSKTGSKYWRLKYRFAGKEKRLAFGVYPRVGLRAARDRRHVARQQLEEGKDPGALKKAEKLRGAIEAEHTFESVAKEWLEHQSARWKEVTQKRIAASLKADIYPVLGSRPIAGIEAIDVMKAVKKIESREAGDMAGRVLQRVKAVFRYAKVHGRIAQNPLVDLMPSEILKPRRVAHRAAMAEKELPRFFKLLSEYDGGETTVAALQLLILTATRPGEVRGARWDEFELEKARWRIPADRMKMRIEHVVPLSTQAVSVLRRMETLRGEWDLVFPSPFYPSRPLSENTFNSALSRMGYKNFATAHGFRALFSTVANEKGWNPDAIERQLAHAERNEVRASYNRTNYLSERAEMMQWWGSELEAAGLRTTSSTLQIQ